MAQMTRRQLLKAGAMGAAAVGFPAIVPASALGRDGAVAPSERIAMGCIGIGGEGTKNLNAFLNEPDAQVVALCEVDPVRMAAARKRVVGRYKNEDVKDYADFREVLARKDIDAVMISTPDHWHVPMSLMAVRAGKDVICEKPTLTIEQGRVLADAVKRSAVVFQTSTEDRSVPQYLRMAELVRNGRIGKLQTIRVGLPGGRAGLAAAKHTPEAVPAGFDYEMWLGPAPWAPYCAARCHFNFRWVLDYSGGWMTDWGLHLLDTAQWGNNTECSGPTEVSGTGEFSTDGIYNVPWKFHVDYTYASGVKMTVDGGRVFLRFEGTDGWVGNDGWRGAVQASSREIMESVIRPAETHLYTCAKGEHRNFLDCVKSRRAPYFPAEIGHRCSTVAHIGNISMILGRKLRWDPEKEEFVNDEQANRMRSRAMREPWRL